MAKYEITHSGHCKTYASLMHTAWHLLDRAEKDDCGSLLNLQAAIVFIAFSFEAYLNHVGEEEIPFWSEIDRISHGKKMKVLSKHLGFVVDKSCPPFQAVEALFKMRNALAHGRTMPFTESYVSDSDPDRDAVWRMLPWEKLTAASVRRFYEDARRAIEQINNARARPDERCWSSGMRGTTINGPIEEQA